ncbi:MAG: 3'-5' exonuclease [Actinomycetes bacterium]
MAAERLVVVDVETTGFAQWDRVVEVAAVTLDARTLAVVDEFETLVDPQRGVGPTAVHGITAAMVADAPTFAEIAGLVGDQLHGSVMVAHNIKFDRRMLEQEFEQIGPVPDWGEGICTLGLTGAKLVVACERYGIVIDGHHRALADARATAELLRHVLDPEAPTAPVRVSRIAGPRTALPYTREAAARLLA